MAANLALWHGRRAEIVLAGDAETTEYHALEAAVAASYLPWAVVVPIEAPAPEAVPVRAPWLRAMTARQGRATAYVCYDQTCQAPVTDPAALAAQLDDAAAPRRILL
jgi:uncharacterized protein YyaL (SSP411 family)